MQEFIDRLINQLPNLFTSIEDLRNQWADPDTRDQLLTRLKAAGFIQEQLDTLSQMFSAESCDTFDLLAFLAFEQPMASRHKRAAKVRNNSNFFAHYQQESAKDFLNFLLDRFEETGSSELARNKLPDLIDLSGLGTIRDASAAFGGKPAYLLDAFKQLQQQLYQ